MMDNGVQTLNFIVGVESSILPILTGNAEDPAVYMIDPSLPKGLSLDEKTGRIFGNPESTGSLLFVITARKGDLSKDVFLKIIILDKIKDITYGTDSFVLIQNNSVSLFPVLSGLGSSPNLWEILPQPPKGLNFNKTTGVISGVAIESIPETKFKVTGSSKTTAFQSTEFSIKIKVSPPKEVTFNSGKKLIFLKMKYAEYIPNLVGGIPEEYTIQPALSMGLDLNKSTGIISGVVPITNNSEDIEYTITASNSEGRSETKVLISIKAEMERFRYSDFNASNPFAPDMYSESGTLQVVSLSPNFDGDEPDYYYISPDLPSGIVLNEKTGVISTSIISPPRESLNVIYKITAKTEYGLQETSVKIFLPEKINRIYYKLENSNEYVIALKTNPFLWFMKSKDGLSVPINNDEYLFILKSNENWNSKFTPIVDFGGSPTKFRISPDLPKEYTFNTKTGEISGNPGTNKYESIHTISAQNAMGVLQIGIKLVVGSIPKVTYPGEGSLPAIVLLGYPMKVIPENWGSKYPLESCEIIPPLLNNLSLDPANGVIEGNVSSDVITTLDYDYQVKVKNSIGEGIGFIKIKPVFFDGLVQCIATVKNNLVYYGYAKGVSEWAGGLLRNNENNFAQIGNDRTPRCLGIEIIRFHWMYNVKSVEVGFYFELASRLPTTLNRIHFGSQSVDPNFLDFWGMPINLYNNGNQLWYNVKKGNSFSVLPIQPAPEDQTIQVIIY